MQVVRKLALVTLTGYMERYCPTHRSGWNWELPKFIKKIKAPDYKGTTKTSIETNFGVSVLETFSFSSNFVSSAKMLIAIAIFPLQINEYLVFR